MPPELAELLRAWITDVARAEVAKALDARSKPNEYLPTREAADFARVSTGTIRRWIREGRLEKLGAGREIRVRRDQLEQLMSGGEGRRKRISVARPKRDRRLSPEEEAFAMLGL